MCGIAGFIDYSLQIKKDTLVSITDTISYRGPDDSGYEYYIKERYHIGFGHRRLSIIDLSSSGHQPMHYKDWMIVFNGEIYNYKEIKAELIQQGEDFKSTSDTEVILKAVNLWGLKITLEKLNGMFAFALFNHQSQELFLIRDRIGVKPLYYFFDNNSFIFSSELKPIMAYPFFEKKINPQSLNMYLYHGYITAPHTIFENTYKLEPGKFLILKNKQIDIQCYWSLQDKFKNRIVNKNASETNAIKTLDDLITDSVRYRMIADVPVGAFLSGGYDSSLVSAIMQKISNQPINTFTIGFDEPQYNEAQYAKIVAKYLKTNHLELYFPIKKAEELIFDIPYYYDEPFADSSQIPSMLVSQLAKKHVKVALSGDGGDEIFCGYERYNLIEQYKKYKPFAKLMHLLIKKIPASLKLLKKNRKFLKIGYLNTNDNIINNDYCYSQHYLNNIVKHNNFQLDRKYFDILSISQNSQEAAMLQDMITYLPDDILTKVDRATMSVSLEGRDPLLDYHIFEYSFTLPHILKNKNGQKKYLLKQLAHQYIPEKILDRPKMGFGIPIYKWLKTDLSYLLEEYLSEKMIKEQNIFDYKAIQNLIKLFSKDKSSDYFSRLIWHLVVFQMWAKDICDDAYFNNYTNFGERRFGTSNISIPKIF